VAPRSMRLVFILRTADRDVLQAWRFGVALKASTDPCEHLAFGVDRPLGHTDTFEGRDYMYATVDGRRYWALWLKETIINRRVAPA
jgi:hypothetical protein